ncbi:MAG: flagellar basal-body rod protein FlgF [Myxococcales bacterium]|nr:flagellar basal-body rod protein FlgF [Myxococcales bacterium]
MSNGIYSALSGAIAQERNLAIVANNVANANTTGFRADRASFKEVLARAQSGTQDSTLKYVDFDRVAIDAAPGSLRETGGRLDVALDGDGYIAVQTADGERYTRTGSLLMDSQGVLRTQGGDAVLAEGGSNPKPLTLPENAADIRIGRDGSIDADGTPVGRIRVVRFDGEEPLVKDGLTLMKTRGGVAPRVDDRTSVLQGYLENSNINAVSGMHELITVSRSFEAFQRVIRAFEQIDGRTARELGARS